MIGLLMKGAGLALGLGRRAITAAPGLARSWWKAGLGAAIGAALALPVGQCQGRGQERQANAVRVAAAAELQAEKNRAAAEAAALQRDTDAAKVDQAEKERNHAIDAAPPGRAGSSSLALTCQRLRQQGARPETLPAYCRPDGAR